MTYFPLYFSFGASVANEAISCRQKKKRHHKLKSKNPLVRNRYSVLTQFRLNWS